MDKVKSDSTLKSASELDISRLDVKVSQKPTVDRVVRGKCILIIRTVSIRAKVFRTFRHIYFKNDTQG